MTQNIPRIELRDYIEGTPQERSNFIKVLGDGLCHFGFLAVGGHGLDPRLIEKCYADFRKFFSLSEDVKKKYDCVPGGQRGYTPFGVEQAKDSDKPDLKEFWHIGREMAADHPYKGDYPDNVWPDEVPALKHDALELYDRMENCARIILQALAEYFRLPLDTFADMIKDGDSVYRIIHYPALDHAMPPGAIRAAAHEDINMITLLTESQGSGLEILTHDGHWLAVEALAGDIVVDSGDMLSRVTNGLVPATTHRVVNPPDSANHARYSMPFFVHPYAACDLDVLDRFIDEENPAKWPPITAREFLKQRLREIGLLV